MDTGLYTIPLEDIEYHESFGEEVAPLSCNVRKPIIAIEREDHYQLIDGWGRVSGLRNAGSESAEAILVSDDDFAMASGGDDEEWIESMWEKYAPKYTYRRGN